MSDVMTPMTREQRIETIARVCYAANLAWNDAHGEVTLSWEEVRDSVCSGIEGILGGNTPEQSHEAWCAYKILDGWTLGPEKNATFKTHPLLIPYSRLPEFQKVKDTLFSSIIRSLAPSLGL